MPLPRVLESSLSTQMRQKLTRCVTLCDPQVVLCEQHMIEQQGSLPGRVATWQGSLPASKPGHLTQPSVASADMR
jgi:hypothetical protein